MYMNIYIYMATLHGRYGNTTKCVYMHAVLNGGKCCGCAENARLYPKVPKPQTNCIRSTEARSSAADGSLVDLVYEIFLNSDFHLGPRQIWQSVRDIYPKIDATHWKTGAETFFINIIVEKREDAVLQILDELVEADAQMVCALTDYQGDSDESSRLCARRVSGILKSFHTKTLVLPKAAKPSSSAAASTSTTPTPPTPTTPTRGMALKSSAEELGAHERSKVYSAGALLSKNASPILQSKNVTPESRKRFREQLRAVVEAVVAEIPQERPAGALGTNALQLLEYIANTGHKMMQADVKRVKMKQQQIFEDAGEEGEAGAAGAAEEEEAAGED